MTEITKTATVANNRPVQGEWTYQDYLAMPDDGRRFGSAVLPGLQIVTRSLFIPAA